MRLPVVYKRSPRAHGSWNFTRSPWRATFSPGKSLVGWPGRVRRHRPGRFSDKKPRHVDASILKVRRRASFAQIELSSWPLFLSVMRKDEALPALPTEVGFWREESEWNSFLSLRDPAALPGRPGHPTQLAE